MKSLGFLDTIYTSNFIKMRGKMDTNVKDIYKLILGQQTGKKIVRIDPMPGAWMGIVYDDYHVWAFPPFTDQDGNIVSLAVGKK
jgi:hypothetical protein